MKRFSAYATTVLSIAVLSTSVLAIGGCQKHDDQGMQPGASAPAAPASSPAATPPAPSHTSPDLAPPATAPGRSATTAPPPATTSAK